MQKYFIKPGTVDNKNPQQEKSQSPQQYSSSVNVDGQGSNPESQTYGHNDDIHMQGNFLLTIVVIITRKQMLVAAMIIICQKRISRKIYLIDLRAEENNEPQTDDEQSSYGDSVKRISPLESVDVDETFVVSSVVGKSISRKEKPTLLDK